MVDFNNNEFLLDAFEEAAYNNEEVGEEGNVYRTLYLILRQKILDKLNANS